MQIHALNDKGQFIGAQQAQKQIDYFCMECQQRVRLRGGFHRQPHFYHCEPNRHCRLNGKGMVHLQVQEYIQKMLPEGECFLEYRFPDIKRIADAAWLPRRIVFEVQCASISAEEVKRRNEDYRKMDWEVVWILHDKRYNQYRLSAAEHYLAGSTHYFTNLNAEGEGIIYDQFSLINQGLRLKRLPPFPIHICHPLLLTKELSRSGYPHLIQQRLNTWNLSFKRDLIDLCLYAPLQDEIYLQMKRYEQDRQSYEPQTNQNKQKWIKKYFQLYVKRPFALILQILLEKACR